MIELGASVSAAIYRVRAVDGAGSWSSGTAFAIASDLLVTARHTVYGPRLDRQPATIEVGGKSARVRAVDEKRDLLLLQADAPLGVKPLQLIENVSKDWLMTASRQRRLSYEGFPHADEPLCRARAIELLGHLPEAADTDVILTGAFVAGASEGISGAPLLVAQHRERYCVGMLFLGREERPISRFYGSDVLIDFLRRNGVHPETRLADDVLPPHCPASRQGLRWPWRRVPSKVALGVACSAVAGVLWGLLERASVSPASLPPAASVSVNANQSIVINGNSAPVTVTSSSKPLGD